MTAVHIDWFGKPTRMVVCCFSVWYGAFHQVVPWNDAANAWHGKAGQYAMGLCHRSSSFV